MDLHDVIKFHYILVSANGQKCLKPSLKVVRQLLLRVIYDQVCKQFAQEQIAYFYSFEPSVT